MEPGQFEVAATAPSGLTVLAYGKLGPCPVCSKSMGQEDFVQQRAILLTGPEEHVAACADHFIDPDNPEYPQNMWLLGKAFGDRNPSIRRNACK